MYLFCTSIPIISYYVVCAGNGKDSGKFSGRIVDSDMSDVARFLNRLLGLPPEIQNRFFFLTFTFWFIFSIVTWSLTLLLLITCRLFELFVSILDHLLHNARLEGHLDAGIVDMKANTIELQGNPKVTPHFINHSHIVSCNL